MSQEHNNKQADPTQERLLDEAERLFADKGYDGVSLREITAAAGTHLAAVNYHFGSKENLYLEVFRTRCVERARRIHQPLKDLDKRGNFTPEDLVRTLAKAFLSGPLTDEERRRHSQLLAREMHRQSEAYHILTQKAMKPFTEHAIRMWQRCLPHPMEPDRLKLMILSILSQVLYFNFARPVVTLTMGREYDEEFVDQIVEHITQFALCGLNGDKGK